MHSAFSNSPMGTFHNRTFPVSPAVASQRPSGATTPSRTPPRIPSWECWVPSGKSSQVFTSPRSSTLTSPFPPGRNPTDTMAPLCPCWTSNALPVARSNSRTVRSSPPVATHRPSGLTASARTGPRCPRNVRVGSSPAGVGAAGGRSTVTRTISLPSRVMRTTSSWTVSPPFVAFTRCLPTRMRTSARPSPPMTTSSPSTVTFTDGSLTWMTSVPSGVLTRMTSASQAPSRVRPVASVRVSPARSSITPAATPRQRRQREGVSGRGGISSPRESRSRCQASSRLTSPAEAGLRAGSLASNRVMISSSQSGTRGLSVRTGAGSSSLTRRSTARVVLASKGGRPVHIAYRTLPRLNRSVR
jgi:hypothetical protein